MTHHADPHCSPRRAHRATLTALARDRSRRKRGVFAVVRGVFEVLGALQTALWVAAGCPTLIQPLCDLLGSLPWW